MKRVFAVALALTVLLIAASLALAASGYAPLSWWSADAGGGRLTGSSYTLHGTAGQPDAATWQGNKYILQGGLWASVTGSSTGTKTYDVYVPVVIR